MVQSISPASRGKALLSSFASLWQCLRTEASRMRSVFQLTVGLLALMLSACELKMPHATTPSPPQPANAKAEPLPEPASSEPLSIPQTQVYLPNPQPIDPDALATPPINVPAEPSKTR